MAHAPRAPKAIALTEDRAGTGHHRFIDDYLKSAAENYGKDANESIDILLAERRLARRDRGGHGATRPELYQRMLKELTELVKLADDLGYDSVSFTEHHFHIEGFELSNNPVLLDLYFAMQTKRIRVGQLGIVLPAANPIRVAEDIAMLDHMTGGRACAGFARGYQRRWVDAMAQQTHGVSGTLPHHHDAIDQTNREAFEENWQIIKKCWTEEMLTFQGKYWKVPAGATPWDLETTVKYGKGVENGMLTSVGVVPKPLQKPYPPVFLPFAAELYSLGCA